MSLPSAAGLVLLVPALVVDPLVPVVVLGAVVEPWVKVGVVLPVVPEAEVDEVFDAVLVAEPPLGFVGDGVLRGIRKQRSPRQRRRPSTSSTCVSLRWS